MHIEGDRLVYDLRACYCAHGRTPGKVELSRSCRFMYRLVKGRFQGDKCPDCGTTRKDGHKSWIGTGKFETCQACKGSLRVPETRTDSMPDDLVLALPWRVFRLNRGITFNESYLGIGCLWSRMDYGRTWENPNDEAALLEARASLHGTQACHVVDQNDRLPVGIGVLVNRGGYSVRALTLENLAQMDLERPEAEALAVGMRVAAHGGNGTLRGAFRI